jgi:hypothetical protein
MDFGTFNMRHTEQGPMLGFLKYFRPKYWRKNPFCLKHWLLMRKIDHKIGFHEKRQFFRPKIGENHRK